MKLFFQSSDFERAVCYCARALVAEGCDEGVSGLYQWCRDHIGRRFAWLKPAVYSAGNKYVMILLFFVTYTNGDKSIMYIMHILFLFL